MCSKSCESAAIDRFHLLKHEQIRVLALLSQLRRLPADRFAHAEEAYLARRSAARTWREILLLARRERQRRHAKSVFRVAHAQIALTVLVQQAQIGVRTVGRASDRRVAGRKNVIAGVAQHGDVR